MMQFELRLEFHFHHQVSILNADIHAGILFDHGPFPCLRLARAALARPEHVRDLAGAPEPLLGYLGRCKVCTPSTVTLYPDRHRSNLHGVLESNAPKRGVQSAFSLLTLGVLELVVYY